MLRYPAHLLLAASLTICSCGGEIGLGVEGDPEPEDERAIFTNTYPPGTTVTVCGTSVGLNLRSGPGSKYKVIAVLDEDTEATVLSSSGAWHRLDTPEGTGWSHSSYLCGAGSTSSPGTQPAAGCSGSYAHPAPGYPVTSEFGSCRDGCSRHHAGIDLGVPSGTSVRAADGGTVYSLGWMSGYGYAVIIGHCGKSGTLYGHLSKFLVSDGQQVGKGQVIARSGNSGVSTGPHLHFEIRSGGPYGTAVNPRKYIAF